jgi:hypothetical protein
VTGARKWTRLMAGLALALAAGPAQAEWQRLDGPGLVEVLSGAEVDYDGAAWQEFLPSGRTVYRVGEAPTGSSSQGDWRAENDSYCSRWRPGGEWECYWVEVDGAGGIRFIDAYGNISAGHFVTETDEDVQHGDVLE